MRLPDADKRWIPDQKIRNYLLNVDSPKGKSRHDFFVQFGFSVVEWGVLRQALLEQAATASVEIARVDQWGATYRATGSLKSPDGRDPIVTAFWIIRTDDPRPQLTSVVPSGK